MFNLFKKHISKENNFIRSFKGANSSRFTNWINSTLTPINVEINADLVKLIIRTRDLAKNDDVVRAYLSMLEKNIIGNTGFNLQSQIKNSDNTLNTKINDQLEWQWYDFCSASNGYLTVDGQLGSHELDKLILRTLIIDGECFIKIHKNANNPFYLSFEVLDSLSIDWTKNKDFGSDNYAIVTGIEVDKHYKPRYYYVKEGCINAYNSGKTDKIPANEIIHLYFHEFPNQVRGFSPLNACLEDLKHIDDYTLAELLAAKTSACLGIFYERNSNSQSGDFLDQSDDNDPGSFVQNLEPGMASITPSGYNVKSLTPTHPNSNYGEFTKSLMKKIASSLGVSYNKLCKDYENVSFSSLKEAWIDEKTYFEDYQRYLIDNWKEIEYKLFLTNLLIYKNTDLNSSNFDQALHNHHFITQKRAFYDPSKDILGTKYQLELGIKNPIQVIEETGGDTLEILEGWSLWNKMIKDRNLNFDNNINNNINNNILEPIEQQSFDEILNKEGRN